MDQPGQSNQNANVNGNGNTVIIIGGDASGGIFPLPNNLSSSPVANPKPRRSRRWLGASASALALVITGLIGASLESIRDRLNPEAAISEVTADSRPAARSPVLPLTGGNAPVSQRTTANSTISPTAVVDPPPAPPAAWPEGKSAMCKDGWFSESQRRSGTCSGHDGVAHWRYPKNHVYWRRG